jgi:hypothetical protein
MDDATERTHGDDDQDEAPLMKRLAVVLDPDTDTNDCGTEEHEEQHGGTDEDVSPPITTTTTTASTTTITTEEQPQQQRRWIRDVPVLTMDDYLDSDPVENHGDASFTGVWSSSQGLLDFLEDQAESIFGGSGGGASLSFDGEDPPTHSAEVHPPCNILELGSGTGWLGMTVARNIFLTSQSCPGIMVLTDNSHTGANVWAEANLQAAKKKYLEQKRGDDDDDHHPHHEDSGMYSPLDNVFTMPLDWSNATELQAVMDRAKWDVVLGSDLIYSEQGIILLTKLFSVLLQEQEVDAAAAAKRVIYAHTIGRMPELDALWETELAACGLQWKVLAELPVYVCGTVWKGRTTAILDIQRVS